MSVAASLDPIEEKIIQYVKDNPGCSKSDVVRFMRDKQIASRITALTHIDKLENRKMIVYELEKPNSQIYRIYINKDNKLASVLVELEEFKEAYFNLLEKSKEVIKNKDYSVDAKVLGIKETNPAKWSEEDKIKYFGLELNRTAKWSEMVGESERKFEEAREIVGKRLPNILLEKGFKISNRLKVSNEPIEDKLRPLLKFIDNVTVSGLINNQHSGLTSCAVALFNLMADTIFIRSILVWPKTLDIETLSQMYSAVYMKIAEIQLKLSAFLKFGDILPFSDPSTHLMIVRSHGSFALFYIYTQVILCRAYGMGQEIDQVINSLSKLREELGKIEHFEFDMFKIMLDVSKTAAGTTPLRQPQPYHYQMVKDVAEAVRRGVNITGDKEELEEKKKS